MSRLSLALVLSTLLACGDDDGVDPPPDGGPSRCSVDLDCSDGFFCNGAETCDPGSASADMRGCVASSDPCIGDTNCDESERRCITDCDRTNDADADGSTSIDCGGDDCNDSDPNTYPGNTEVCDEGHDEDCDPNTVGPDADGDGYQRSGCCNGEVCGLDCGDESSAISPEGIEVCNGFDDDCDSTFDEGVERVHFRDVDGDRFGDNASSTMRACIEDPIWTQTGDDCDDRDRTVYPGAPQLCDGRDNDCNGSAEPDTDMDRDGHLRTDAVCEGDVLPLDDCDDTDPLIYAGALERCNGVDDDCDGVLDEGANAWCTTRARATGDADATASCGVNGGIARCVVSSCGELRDDCDGVLGNGCEADLAIEVANCGGCGVTCGSGVCDDGLCTPTLDPAETFVSLEASPEGVCGITSAAHVACWGDVGFLTRRRMAVLSDAGGPMENVIDVAVADRCACVLQTGGQVSCAGLRGDEDSVAMCELFGGGTGIVSMSPITGLDDVVDIAQGSDHGCVVRGATRQVWCVGAERLLGTSDGAQSDVLVPVGVLGGGNLDQVIQIDAGERSTCVVRTGGQVFCWGENEAGLLGRGNSTMPNGVALQAAAVASAVSFDRVEVGASHACAITDSDDVYCWGSNFGSQITPSGGPDVVSPTRVAGNWSDMAVSASSDRLGHTCLVASSSGRVECRGRTDDSLGSAPIACPGNQTSCEVRYAGHFSDATITANGDIVTNPAQITAGDFHSCALVDGWPYCWGAGLQIGSANRDLALGLAVPVPLPDPAVQLSTSGSGVCARTSTGQIACWGDNEGQRIARPSAIPELEEAHAATPMRSIDDARHVVLGASATCALLSDGNVSCWGETGANPGTLDTGIVADPAGAPSLVAIDDVVQLDMNGFHACALRRDGSVWCWGESNLGATGRVGTDDTCDLPPCQPTPMEVMGIDGDVVELATGGFASVGVPGFTCARLADGGVSCWGGNSTGSLGLGTIGDPPDLMPGALVSPTRVPGIDDAILIRAAGPGVCVLRAGGTMSCWGGDVGGTLGTRAVMSCGTFACAPSPVDVQAVRDVVDFSIAITRTCATTRDGRVWCYGGEGFAESLPDTGPIPRGPVIGIAFPSELAAALDGHCAIAGDDIFCWGDASRSVVGQGLEVDGVIDPTPIVGM